MVVEDSSGEGEFVVHGVMCPILRGGGRLCSTGGGGVSVVADD